MLFADEIYPFPGGLVSHNSMRIQKTKWAKKLAVKRKEKRKKEREREISK